MLLSACDYPEQGFYELVALDDYLSPVASWPLMVEELTDDTHMTYGFNVLLPVDGELLELPLADSSDLSRRAWTLMLSHSDLGQGDLDLELSHREQRLSFTGAYRLPPPVEPPGRPAMASTDPPAPLVDTRPGYPVGGYVLPADTGRSANLIINGALPPLPETLAAAVSFELRTITRGQFEAVLGGEIDGAIRRLSDIRAPLEVSDEPPPETESQPDVPAEEPVDESEAAPEPEEKPKGPPLGGRDGTRPR